MGGSDMPFLYDGPSVNRVSYPYSDFNPKSVTEASYKRLSQQTTNTASGKPAGPLINFNKHPDSYEVVLGAPRDHKPLSPSSKKQVIVLRWIQFAMRIVQEIGALGLLVATICITGTAGGVTYLLRIPQAFDSLVGLYAIYHLIRPAKSRTPASSYSYHMFSLIMDVGFIPFYIFIAVITRYNEDMAVDLKADGSSINGRWNTFFSTQRDTDLVMSVVFYTACALGGLHLLSTSIDLWLIVLFRKISNLPPDMNPLEDNLTSRRSMKHKHKNSELTLNSELSEIDRKKMAHLSGSTLSVGNQSRASLVKGPEERVMPFGHSRTGSNTDLAFSPHNPESARWSRHQFDGQQGVYQEACTSPRSRYEVRADGKLQVRTRGSHSPSKSNRSSVISTLNINSGVPYSDSRDFAISGDDMESLRTATFTTARTGSPAAPNAAPTQAAVEAQQQKTLLNDNWYVLEDEHSDAGSPSRHHTPAPAGPPVPRKDGYHAIDAPHDRHDSFVPLHSAVPQPLAMHPPTPPMPQEEIEDYYPDPEHQVDRHPTTASNATASSSLYSESAPSLMSSKNGNAGTPKGKYYGNLAAATRGVRGGDPTMGGYGLPPSPGPSRTPSPDKRSSRVISRTGADIADEAVLFVSEGGSKYGMRSRRDVSGKVAEEGRGSPAWGRSR